ncbi:NAD(P)-dependent oxidoreductase [Pseudomonas typographi]|uniref:NAD(P)-dependent oxidoreductase n=1 Tax=Pseudomonas typographi TaxID=2715964 RepID=A0ABR7Z4D6_9PSED|nr:NAD(P)-dependent oxidoreductase [Pseudomonas typographi]MBD1588242.1 NAD(P)-dependent oxidoreductase [Pseudomonas typographi]MBD1600213.1 NAD(P)-dependent oxidoreductase [Pseudomonas typographi]
MNIALIGLGNMGLGIGHNLLGAGFTLTVFNRTQGKAQPLLDKGARWAASPREAAAGAQLVLTMVADDNALLAVCEGADGLLEGFEQGAIHASMSTVSNALVERLAPLHQQHGAVLLGTPVFGRPDAAAAGKLFIVAAGPAGALERARPALEAVSQKLFVVGEQPQQAALVKLIGNFLLTCVIEGLGEATALAAKGGIEPKALLEVLTGSIFNAPVYHTYGKLIVEQQFEPAGFTVPLAAKDNRLVLQAAEALHVPLPFASIVRDRFIRAQAQGKGEQDLSSISALAREDAGVKR